MTHAVRKRDLRLLLLASAAGLSLAGMAGAGQAQEVINTGTVNVPGDHATPWTLPGSLIVGNTGTATLNIGAGGVAGAVSDTFIEIGKAPGSDGTVNVTGVGSTLTNSSGVNVGVNGTGTLNISGGGVVADASGFIGVKATGVGHVVVTGAGSKFTNSGGLTVGVEGAGDLTVSDGGLVTTTLGLFVGDETGSSGSVTVTGAGSKITSTLAIGGGGQGALSVLNGGVVSGKEMVLGAAPAGVGTVTVSGSGSLLAASQAIYVGFSGEGTLKIENNGDATAAFGVTIGKNAGSHGTLRINSGGALNALNADFIVGDAGTGNLTIGDGISTATVTSARAFIGNLAGGTGEVLVGGPDASWTNTFDLTVGNAGKGSLTIENGGQVTAANVFVGKLAGQNGSISIQSGGKLTTGDFHLGESGNGSLLIQSGGQLRTTGLSRLGDLFDSQATATVKGAGSFWDGSGANMYIGTYSGSAAALNITGGGRVAVQQGLVGRDAGQTGVVTVSGAGSRWEASGVIRVGGGGKGELIVADGGVVSISGGTGFLNVAQGAGSTGNLYIGARDGSPAVAPGTLDVATVGFGSGTGQLIFNHDSSSYVFAPKIQDAGSILHYAGVTHLTGNSAGFSGTTTVNGGMLLVDGTLGGTVVDVNSGGILGGQGTITNSVVIENGGLLSGVHGQTLTMGSLTLNNTSVIEAVLGADSDPALFSVTGQLTLDGTLNVFDGPGFGQGVYRLFNYGGGLTDNGLDIGATPGGITGTYSIQTSVSGQVNLVLAGGGGGGGGGDLLFWDGGDPANAANGQIDGGNGSWTATAPNWTDVTGSTNGAMSPQPGFVVFENGGSTVTVSNVDGQVAVTGMQFAADGYEIEGEALELADAQTVIRVGDGTEAGADFRTIIASELTGGGLVKTDLGTLILTGDNTYAGGTTINAGTLQIGAGGTTGSILGDVVNHGVLAFGRSDATMFDGAISGAGEVVVKSGVVGFHIPQTYTGMTRILAGGTLEIYDGGGFGSDVEILGTLAARLTGILPYDGSITGDGVLIQNGDGEFRLTGDSSAFTGETRVEHGTLRVDGLLGGDIGVFSGGTLKGYGVVGGTTVSSGGTIAPGGSIGTLFVAGNYTQAAGSTYQLEVSPGVGADLIAITGQASLNGSVNLVKTTATPFLFGQRYTILTATGGVTGTYASLTGDIAPVSLFIGPKLSYDATHVYLDIAQVKALATAAATENQTAAANGADSLPDSSPLKYALLNLQTTPVAQAAFDAISGEAHPSARGVLGEDAKLPREAVLRRLSTPGLEGPSGWGEVFGGTGTADGDIETGDLKRDVAGILVGGDVSSGGWRFGVAGGYSRSSFDLDARHSSAEIETGHLAAYAGGAWGPVAIRLGAALSGSTIKTERTVAFPGYADQLRASYEGSVGQGFVEAGYGLSTGALKVEPFAGLAITSVRSGSFQETGGPAALRGEKTVDPTLYSTLGARFATAPEWQGPQLRGLVAWRHVLDGDRPETKLSFAGGSPFTVMGAPLADDSLAVEFSVGWKIGGSGSLDLSYGGAFADGAQENMGRATLSFSF